MSLIHTCQLCRANPFDYLTELERHAAELSANPDRWMPWNYRETLHGPLRPSLLADPAPMPCHAAKVFTAAARTRYPGQPL